MMQAQLYPLPFHHQPLYDNPSFLAPQTSSHYSQTDGLDHIGFSRGSPTTYPQQHYDYFFQDRGGQSRLLEWSSNSFSPEKCATGEAIPGIPCSFAGGDILQPEGISEYELQQQQWPWSSTPESFHGVTLVSNKILPRVDPSMIKGGMSHHEASTVVLSPAAQLPTPASMAILLNPNSHSECHTQQISFQQPSNVPLPPGLPQERTHHPLDNDLGESIESSSSREKKHGCTMCHKRFDRPSTLKKHLLVHTGEKAFVCDTCGRRFGVASNLNRHVRRCILKPVNSASVAKPDASSTPDHTGTSIGQPQWGTGRRPSPPRKDPNAPKRRRRAPSPSRWIPPSLLSFNLSPPEAQRATQVPLPPVRRNLPLEERDSWDENVASSPYHPRGWKNVLPGPGLRLDLGFGGKDVGNLNLKANSGFVLGRVLVF